ncbi:cysteine-rich secretory protein 3-like [Gordionus sp. m RMFG-2023]|uniref:cysteine-rich secretory protein 3-like n=1 Tax=Gordionus sp. m RMFG-2023 TaxID=3053472 RepID=UPI0031FD941C
MLLTILCTLVLMTVTTAKIPNATEIQDILKAHNDYRSTVKPPSSAMYKLIWNNEGALKAQALTQKCVFSHDTNKDRATSKYKSGGQNLYATTGTSNWKNAVKTWYNEVSSFTFGVDKGNFASVGHYTQVVWGTTKEVGCGMTECSGQKIFACNYYPSGNLPPYYAPYEKSAVQSCKGCIKGGVCSSGVYAGKLLDSCDLFCVNAYSNCDDLAKQGACSSFKDKCAKSCLPECKS